MNANPTATDWFRAATIRERLAGAREAWQRNGGPAATEGDERALQRWRAESAFTDAAVFDERLERAGLGAGDLQLLLGESQDALAGRFAADRSWMGAIERAYAAPVPDLSDEAADEWGLVAVARPLMRQALDRLRADLAVLHAAHPDAPFDVVEAEVIAADGVPNAVLGLIVRTLSLELQVAKLREGLTGDTPEARFRSFVRRLNDPEVALAIWREYPVLARTVYTALDQWARFAAEILRHLAEDWPEIRARFSPHADPGRLVAFSAGDGDQHRDGRSVRILTFESGLRLVYKPRSLAIDVAFQGLLTWLNQQGADPDFRVLTVLDRGDHGWVEFVEHVPCATSDEARRFYFRQGGYLALFHVLNATDFHSSNLIASGEHPVPIDLETLLHPDLPVPGHEQDPPAVLALQHSVMRIGLLPRPAWGDPDGQRIDVSGLSDAVDQLSPDELPAIEGFGTDELRIERRRTPIEAGVHRPVIDGEAARAGDHLPEILSGFAATYRLLLRHHAQLSAAGGPLAAFAGVDVRVVVRPTRRYALLLNESRHPDVQRDALTLERFLDRLWIEASGWPALASLVEAERADLLRGDIPFFHAHAGERTLVTSDGVSIPDVLVESPYDLLRRSISQMSEADLDRQLWLVEVAFAGAGVPIPPAASWTAPLDAAADPGALPRAVDAVARRLDATAIWHGDEVTWLSIEERDDGVEPGIAGLTLYDGLPGIALFLAYHADVTGNDRSRALAEGAVRTVREMTSGLDGSAAGVTLGAFTGLAGLIYSYLHLGVLWQATDLLDEAERLAGLLPPLIERDQSFDVIAGSAGVVATLLALHAVRPSARTLAVAKLAGDRLLATAQPLAGGLGWQPAGFERPLTGFSHGAAGVAWALDRLCLATGDSRYAAAAAAARTFERARFSDTLGNWPDLRWTDDPAASPYQILWCHGAPGIGLSRLALRDQIDDPELTLEVETAVRTTLALATVGNQSLCHGDLGNLELPARWAVERGDAALAAAVAGRVAAIARAVEAGGAYGGTRTGLETRGLMLGIAGIGYGLLGFAAPGRVPSVLLLEPPTWRG